MEREEREATEERGIEETMSAIEESETEGTDRAAESAGKDHAPGPKSAGSAKEADRLKNIEARGGENNRYTGMSLLQDSRRSLHCR